jgi:vancomycin resistance protein VanW
MRFRMSRIALGVAIAVVVLAVIALALTLSFGGGARICRDVTVCSVAVGGLTRAQAAPKIEAWAADRVKREVLLTALDSKLNVGLEDFGARVDMRSALDCAFAVGRKGGIFHRAACVLTPWGGGKHVVAEFLVDRPRLRKAIAGIARRVDRPHKDASLRVTGDRLEIRPDGCGIKLNRDRSVDLITRAVATGLAVIPLPVEVDRPDVTANDAVGIDTLLSRFTTSFNPGKVGRTHNLRLAANALSGIVLKAGMPFSTNPVIGPRLMSRGFKNAPIFIKGKVEEGLGGGVCQVSSTLYNAVLLAGLKVLERSHHSRTVPYVTPGRDATVAYGLIDFRFRNTNSAPVGLITHVKGSRLTVDIYGSAADKKDVKVFASVSRWVPTSTQMITDASLPVGARRLVEKGARGVSVTVYRKCTSPEGEAVTEVVSRDRYLPQKAIMAIGRIGAATNTQ